MTAAPGLLTRELNWTWAYIGGGVRHLIPGRVLPRSRTACGREIANGYQLGMGLAGVPCEHCLARNGGER
jgi:hypothetical protein